MGGWQRADEASFDYWEEEKKMKRKERKRERKREREK